VNDYYKFTIVQNGKLTLNVKNTRLDKTGDFGTIFLLDNSGNIIKSNTGPQDDAQITHDLTPGIYYIKISCDGDKETAEYSLTTTLN